MNIGKGGNCVISLLHHFLATHGLGEANLFTLTIAVGKIKTGKYKP